MVALCGTVVGILCKGNITIKKKKEEKKLHSWCVPIELRQVHNLPDQNKAALLLSFGKNIQCWQLAAAKELKQFDSYQALQKVKQPTTLIRAECLLCIATEGHKHTHVNLCVLNSGANSAWDATSQDFQMVKTTFPGKMSQWWGARHTLTAVSFFVSNSLCTGSTSSSNRIWRGRVWTPGSKNNHLASTGSWERALGQE